jgi:hypothetical protein
MKRQKRNLTDAQRPAIFTATVARNRWKLNWQVARIQDYHFPAILRWTALQHTLHPNGTSPAELRRALDCLVHRRSEDRLEISHRQILFLRATPRTNGWPAREGATTS